MPQNSDKLSVQQKKIPVVNVGLKSFDRALLRSPISDYDNDMEWITDVLVKYAMLSGKYDMSTYYVDNDEFLLGDILLNRLKEKDQVDEDSGLIPTKNTMISDKIIPVIKLK